MEPHHLDPRARATATLLDRLEPAWTILYGTWTRRFYAIPHFATSEPLLLEARNPYDLTDQMRTAEQHHLRAGVHIPLGTTGWHRVPTTAAA